MIYKQYDQQQLNDQYNNRLHVPGYATYFERGERLSTATRKNYPFIKDVAYGGLPGECLDIFYPGKKTLKTLVYIHGGYWHLLDKADFHFIANGYHDLITVFINYPLAPFAILDAIVASCRKALLWLHQNIEKFNGDPNQIFVAGHSAGGHLASMLMEKEWVTRNQVHFIKGVCTLSGIFNLVPVQLSNLNAVLGMDKAMALRNSAAELTPADICPLLLFVGTEETNEFKSQSLELYTNWKNKLTDITLLQLPGINHFSIPETLIDEGSPVYLAMRKLLAF